MNASPENLLIRGRLPKGGAPVDVAVVNGRVTGVAPAGTGPADFGHDDALLTPTLFDIQVNGAGGFSLQGGEVTVDDVLAITRLLAHWGVACWVPTLITGPLDAMEHGCRVLAEAMQHPEVAGAVPGIHLEGPWISPDDGPRGAHPRDHVRPPAVADFERLQRAAGGGILYVTLSPSWPGAPEFIRMLSWNAVTIALGHHDATAAEIHAAALAGARLCTHLGNGLKPQLHRHENPLWPQLADDRLAAALIADGHHVPPDFLQTVVRVKGPKQTVLVSDAVEITGCASGPYRMFGADVDLRPDRRICLRGTELLAGSGSMLLEGVFHAAAHTTLTLAQAFACASQVPARLLGVRRAFTPPRPKRLADFLVVDTAGDMPRVLTAFIDGRQVLTG
jgi:N-acetylglucosamine-6-phosphate deacetylase